MKVRLVALALCLPALAQPAKKTPLPEPPPAQSTNVDLAYGAFQRGRYLTAFAEAEKRAKQNDPVAMTLIGQLYANGLGVPRDDAKAAEWYQRAADRGDRNAMFALAMFAFQGRNGPRDPDKGAKYLSEAAKLGHPLAEYDLGLL